MSQTAIRATSTAPRRVPARRPGPRPPLRLIVSPPSRAVYWRRRVVVALAAVLLLGAVVTAVGALASRTFVPTPAAERVAGHVVVEPGQTLWQVAVASAPDGVDPRAQLAAIQDLNGFDGGDVAAWTVVLLPAR